jgi:transposase InsO family protein
MPWAQTDPMSERLRFVSAARKNKSTFRGLCAAFGIAPKTGYKWLHQFEVAGPEGLQDRSRRPKSNSRAISPAVAERLVQLRLANPTYGPKKLVALLERNEPTWDVPASSTVGELLQRRGLVVPRKGRHRARPGTGPLSHADKPNAVWAMDFKGWFRLCDGTRCEPLTITDAFSRYLLCCRAGTVGPGISRTVWAELERLFREYGMPFAMRFDNGQPWATPKGEIGITTLAVKLLKSGITLERIDPGKPYQNGRHERFHLTLKQETAQPPQPTIRAQQRRFDSFRTEYNHHRPHEALGQRVPGDVYVASRRRFPDRIPDPEYPPFFDVVTPRSWGRLVFRGAQYFTCTPLAGERVGLVEIEEDCFEVYFCNHLLGRIHTAHPELGLVTA